jgi:chemotaxis methyl-accepting protein methylase
MPALLRKYNIRSINDAPCGDFNYMKEINLTGIKYTGFDIANELTELNIKKYKKKNLDFIHFDVVNEVLPFCDMILSRDMLIHFSYKDSLKTIENFKKSGVKYLLIINYPQISINFRY